MNSLGDTTVQGGLLEAGTISGLIVGLSVLMSGVVVAVAIKGLSKK